MQTHRQKTIVRVQLLGSSFVLPPSPRLGEGPIAVLRSSSGRFGSVHEGQDYVHGVC